MKEFRRLGDSLVFVAPVEGRSGRIAVTLDDERIVEADYWATEHRLEICFAGHRLVRGATSWCNAIRWGHEYKTGQEAVRAALEVEHTLDSVSLTMGVCLS